MIKPRDTFTLMLLAIGWTVLGYAGLAAAALLEEEAPVGAGIGAILMFVSFPVAAQYAARFLWRGRKWVFAGMLFAAGPVGWFLMAMFLSSQGNSVAEVRSNMDSTDKTSAYYPKYTCPVCGSKMFPKGVMQVCGGCGEQWTRDPNVARHKLGIG